MKRFSIYYSVATLFAAGGLGTGVLQGQEAQVEPKVGGRTEARETSPDSNESANRNATTRSVDSGSLTHQAGHVGKINKATGVLGMEVLNSQNERLGTIKDVVLDLNAGQVSYAVLSVGGFLGLGDKLIAVPLNAFSYGPEHEKLVLNVDKARLKELPALEKDAWPSLNDPQVNAHWNAEHLQTGVGSVQGIQTRRELGSASTENHKILGSDTDASTSRKLDARDAQGNVFSGRIAMIDPEKRVMRVEGEQGTREFRFTERPTLVVGGSSRNPSLVDLKVGYSVNVGYHDEGGSYTAHRVIRTDPPSTR